MIRRLPSYKVKNKTNNIFRYKYQIGVLNLYDRFEISINRYLKGLKSNSILEKNFGNIFKKYGLIDMY